MYMLTLLKQTYLILGGGNGAMIVDLVSQKVFPLLVPPGSRHG